MPCASCSRRSGRMSDNRYSGLKSFTPETAPRNGRRLGSRNKLAHSFVEALQREFEAHGEATIRAVRVDRPVEFLKIIASILPKEFEIVDSRLKDVPDEQLDAIVEY